METKEKNKKLLIVVGVLLLFGGLSLAYFVTKILTNGNGGNTRVTTAVINGATINVEGILSFEDLDILPGHKSVSAIKLTATGNNDLIPYNLIWKGTNTLTTPLEFKVYKASEELSVTSTCEKKKKAVGSMTHLSEECSVSNLDKLGSEIASGTINKNDSKVILAKDEFVTATSTGDVKYYYVILEYPNLNVAQNEDLSGVFEGEVTVEESNIKPDINILAVYVSDDNENYNETTDIPQEGYVLSEKSTCSNNAEIRMEDGELITSNLTKSGTSCYLYFNKLKTVNTILGNMQVNPEIKTKFDKVAKTDEGIQQASDGMYGGTSYYWRGAATTNYLQFGGYCWRIIRINGDGTIRLIYDGTTCQINGYGNVAIEKIQYNSKYNHSEYVGWSYVEGQQRPSDGVSGVDSNIKAQTDIWYNEHLKSYESKIADGKFCNDRNTVSGSDWSSQPTSMIKYSAFDRIAGNSMPTLNCANNDIYTLKIGAITADEVMYAGGVRGVYTSYYLSSLQPFWTMTASHFDTKFAVVYAINAYGLISADYVSGTLRGLKPVINLKADVTISSGNGTLDNPYIVAD